MRTRLSRAAALALALLPGVAAASSFRGLGVMVAAMFAGVPIALLELVLLVLSLVFRRKPPRTGIRIYAATATWASVLCLGVFPLTALVLEQPFGAREAALAGFLWL